MIDREEEKEAKNPGIVLEVRRHEAAPEMPATFENPNKEDGESVPIQRSLFVEEADVEKNADPKVIVLHTPPPTPDVSEHVVELNEVPQAVAEFSLTTIARLLHLADNLQLVDMRVSDRRENGEKVLQVKVAGMGVPPMKGKIPIVSLSMDRYPLMGWRISWGSGHLLAAFDSTPLNRATWPTDGSEKPIPPQG